jgi:hypothetical protein
VGNEVPLVGRYPIFPKSGGSKLTKRRMLIEKIHEEIGQFGEMQTLVEVKKRFYLA